MNFDPAALTNFLLILTAWAAAFLVALWLSLIFWTYRDIKARARDPLSRILAVLVVAVLFLPGILIYLILRPAHTLEEEYQITLEEEALLQAIEENPICPGCGRRIKDEWSICPNCHTKLRKNCHHCGRLMELPWNICPHCGTPAPGMRREHLTIDEALRPLEVNSENEEEALQSLEVNAEPEEEAFYRFIEVEEAELGVNDFLMTEEDSPASFDFEEGEAEDSEQSEQIEE
jgi:RNA polymerase subunit RPABC4/transcription elongation factor Spt4